MTMDMGQIGVNGGGIAIAVAVAVAVTVSWTRLIPLIACAYVRWTRVAGEQDFSVTTVCLDHRVVHSFG